MDSITQIVLGAAVGELVAGKKLGNRAMVWGAIAGTIPDLDILANHFMNDIEALAIHRGITHSFFFALLFPWFFAWISHSFYASKIHQNKIYRAGVILANVFLFSMLALVINLIIYSVNGGWSLTAIVPSIALLLVIIIVLYDQYFRKDQSDVKVEYWVWVKLHFWAVFTHPLLDSCTTYGTQLFQPFWDYRVAFDNISVADPAYTLPFLLLILSASFFAKNSSMRKWLTMIGLSFSVLYLAWTFKNKMHVDQVFENSLKERQLNYSRMKTTPTILNNFLWNCTAESDSVYYQGWYSILDSEPKIKILREVPKNREVIEGLENERVIEVLQWFTDGYYNTIDMQDSIIFNDLRFGAINEGEEPVYVFSFILKKVDGRWVGKEAGRDRGRDDLSFSRLIERIKGI